MSDFKIFDPGEVIFLEGEASNSMYILEEGEVEVIKDHRVISVIKEKRSFFGEMAYLLGDKRTATLKAKTRVKAMVIEFHEGEAFGKRLSSASMTLLKVMAQRLDDATREMTRLAPYEYFSLETHKKAQNFPEFMVLVENIDREIFEKQRKETHDLMSDYMMTPHVWTRLKACLVDVLNRSVNARFDMKGLEPWNPGNPPLGSINCVAFEGERSGWIILDVDEKLGQAIDTSNVGDDDLARHILEELSSRSSEFDITLKEPESLKGYDEVTRRLGGKPAIKMTVESSAGKMRLIYQLT